MRFRVWIKRAVCLLCAAALVAALTACGKNKKKAGVREPNPYALSDPGELTSKGYELPYEYEDGYKAVVPAVENSEFFTASKTPGGNMTFHLTTDKSVDEVQKFYDEYSGYPHKSRRSQHGSGPDSRWHCKPSQPVPGPAPPQPH